jgi:ABC-type tungstate transport system substrate-binding protein
MGTRRRSRTPFAVWVEFPRAAVVAPALTFLRSITIVGLLLIVGGSFVIRTVTRRMTTPSSN